MSAAAIESLPEGSAVVHVGSASFLSPWRVFQASGSQLARLQVAAMLEPVNDMGPAVKGLLSGIEAEMFREARRRSKIPEGRALRASAEVDIADGPLALVPARDLGLEAIDTADGPRYVPEPYTPREAPRSAALDKFDRVAAIQPENVAIDPKLLKEDQRRDFKRAQNKLASADRRKTARSRIDSDGVILGYGRMTQAEKDERREARETMIRLQRELLASQERGEVDKGRAEMLALAHARGETYAWSGNQLTRKNGLDTLLMSGALAASEHAAGEKYAEIYSDAKKDELRIAAWAPVGGCGTVSPEAERKRRIEREEAKRKLTELHGYVQARVNSARAITILRQVAGDGKHVSHVSKGGSDRALNTKALKDSLAALADRWGLQ